MNARRLSVARFLGPAAILIAAAATAAEPDKAVIPAKSTSELEQRITKILTDRKVPGAGLVIANQDGIVWITGIGKADVAEGKAVTPDTLFRIGSISKTFAALAALKLVEEGRLKLETPVHSLVPDVQFSNPWEATDPVRVVHLLEHTTGWDDWHLKEYAHSDPKPATLAEGLALCPQSRTSRWRPGTRSSYCNSGPAVAAAVVEKVTGQRFEDYVEANFFKPIGMPTADYLLSPRTEALLTKLYHEDGRTPYPYWHIAMRPAGSINASAREMGAHLRFFLRRGEGAAGRILSESSIVRMETPTTYWGAQGGLKTGYGLHNYTTLDDLGFVWHGHNGGVDGGLSEMAYLPEQGVGYFFSINSGNGEAFDKIAKELKAFMTRELPRPTLPAAQPIPLRLQQDYSGWYLGDNPREQMMAFIDPILGLFHVSLDGDKLRLSFVTWTETYLSVGGPRFRGEKKGAADVVLMETEAGRIFQTSGGTMRKISALRAWTGIVLTTLFVVAVVSVPLFALVWGTRWGFRRMKEVPNLHARVLPLLAVLSLGAFIGIIMLGGDDLIARLGHRTWWSMGLTASTWAFAAFSVASLLASIRVDRRGMNRWAYTHTLLTSILLSLATLYLAFFGIIGLRTWI
jgi:CubicO group peptidase (beta-lactamase class C family)